MNTNLYLEILEQLKSSAVQFSNNPQELSDEILEDLSEVINVIDITVLKVNIDGEVKDVSQLLMELKNANKSNDKQKCIESIAMLRCIIADIESAFSNTMDSMEGLIVSIRDNK